jgi:hypothetical protein
LKKDCQRIEHLGLTLAEAKQLLNTIQQRLHERQISAFLAAHSYCKACGAALQVKGYHTRRCRKLCGTFKLPSPRLYNCQCQRRKITTYHPLTALLNESVAVELLCIETK